MTNKDIEKAKRLLSSVCELAAPNDDLIMQGIEGERTHAMDVLHWVLKFDENASLPLKLAALFHDVDRLANPKLGGGFKGDRGSKAYQQHKKNHARRSADYIVPLLDEEQFPIDDVTRTAFLIVHHDDQGNKLERLNDSELNHLVSADTFAFFTSIAPKLYEAEGETRFRDKVAFMIEKLPELARQTLWEHQLENPVFESVKNEVIKEFYLKNSVREKLYRFCPTCKARLVRQDFDGESFLSCKRCSFVYWNPPHPVTSVAVWDGHSVLLMRRAIAPLKDYWCLPGGYVRYDETPEVAVAREFMEETGLRVRVEHLLGVYQIDNDPRGLNLDIIFSGTIVGGEMRLSHEGSELRWFGIDELPSRIAYKHREAIIDGADLRRPDA